MLSSDVRLIWTMPKILLAEDDVSLGETILEWLEGESYFVDWEKDGQSALDYLLAFQYDAVVLDWQLPGLEGPEICKQYRSKGGRAPILFLTSKGSVDDKEIGFDAGADDYLPKPFQLKELSMRLRALLRRPPVLHEADISRGPYLLKVGDHRLFYKNRELKLSPIEYSLIYLLMRNEGTVFSTDTLLDRAWPSTSERSADTLKTCIKRLRDKIEDAGGKVIQNVYGVGYKFVAPATDS